MNKTKATTDFSDYLDVDLSPVAQAGHDGLAGHAGTFPSPPVALATLQGLIDTYKAALAARVGRARADVLACQAARESLEAALGHTGNYVNQVAQGDAALVAQSGFPTYQTGGTPDLRPPGPPLDVRLRHGKLSGEIVARFRPQRARSLTEAQLTTGDPGVEAGWTTAGFFTAGRATLTGLTPGTTYWVRLRTAGLRGVMGAWSDPATIMSL